MKCTTDKRDMTFHLMRNKVEEQTDPEKKETKE